MNRSNYDIEEESLEEHVNERNVCIYDSNDIHVLNVGDKFMNIDNVMELRIVVTFANVGSQVLIRVGHIEIIIISPDKVRYVHLNNQTLVNTLDYS